MLQIWLQGLPCCKKRRKKVQENQENGLGYRGQLKVLNVTKLILNYNKEVTHASDVPYSSNQFLG